MTQNAQPKNSRPTPHYSPDREGRVAEALRENLRKRKAQMQERAAQPEPQSQNN